MCCARVQHPIPSATMWLGGWCCPNLREGPRGRAVSPLLWGIRPGIPACFTPHSVLFHSLEQLVSPPTFPATSSPDPCAKETVLNAIRESRKRAVEEEEEEDQTFENDQESKRR